MGKIHQEKKIVAKSILHSKTSRIVTNLHNFVKFSKGGWFSMQTM
jgi:hypothetical protein